MLRWIGEPAREQSMLVMSSESSIEDAGRDNEWERDFR